jgi:hypothetical protein
MVIVDPPSCCYYKLNVPHGIITIEHIWGKNNGQMIPGYYCCYLSYKRIAAMVTKNAVQFTTPVSVRFSFFSVLIKIHNMHLLYQFDRVLCGIFLGGHYKFSILISIVD